MDTVAPRDTRSLLLDGAEVLVMRHGGSGLTFDALARATGISKGGILHHFPSKEDLASAMIERAIAEFEDAMREVADDDPVVPGRLARAYLRVSLGNLPGVRQRPGPDYDRLCASITIALLNHQQRLTPIQEQGARHQEAVVEDGLDPVLATIVRLAVDGLWLSENFGLMRYDAALKRGVAERLLSWTRNPPTEADDAR